MPKIMMFLHSFEPGGVERVAFRLADAWVRAGLSTFAVIGRAEGAAGPQSVPYRVEILQRGRMSTRRFETLWMIANLPRIVARERPDLLFCAGNTYAAVAVALRLMLGAQCPPVVAKVSNDLERRDLPRPLRFLYHLWLLIQGRWIDHFVALSPAMRSEIAAMMGISQQRISVIEDPGLTLEEVGRLGASRPPGARPHRGRRFLAVGRLARQKNFPLLLHAFARIAGEDDRLVILGDGPERRRLEGLAERLGIADRLRLPGHVDPMDGWWSGADTFVLSSDYEGLPAVLVEAIAAGPAIVATGCSPSVAEILDRGRFGTIVARRDPRALAAAMRNADPDRVPPLADRSAWCARYTIERGARLYADLMRRLAHATQPRADGANFLDARGEDREDRRHL